MTRVDGQGTAPGLTGRMTQTAYGAVALVVALVALVLGAGWWSAHQVAAPKRASTIPTAASAAAMLRAGEVPLLLFEPLTELEAAQVNASIPIAAGIVPPAAPFILSPTDDPVTYARALDCMTTAIYFEAGYESSQGQAAVAQVILNRMRHPLYPKSICGVVFQGSERITGCQFSFTCDGALTRVPNPAIWTETRRVAAEALAGAVEPTTGWATHYHAEYVVAYWAHTLVKTAVIGTHIFYRLQPGQGSPARFAGAYAATEPVIALMAGLSSEPLLPLIVPQLTDAEEEAMVAGARSSIRIDGEPLQFSKPTEGAATSDRPTIAEETAPAAPAEAAAPGVAQPQPYFPPPNQRRRPRLPM